MESVQCFAELSASQFHCLVKVLVPDGLSDSLCLCHDR
jgi:hypothetical protein